VRKTRIAVVLLVGVLVVSVLAFAMPTSTVPVAEAADACTFRGHVFVGGMPVPCNTRIQVLQGSNVLGQTYTGGGCFLTSPPRPAGTIPLEPNEYEITIYEITIVETLVEQARARALEGTVNFRIEWDCGGGVVLLMAVETALFDTSVMQDLHSSCPVGGIVEPVDPSELEATSGELSDGTSNITFIALGTVMAVLLAAFLMWSFMRRRVDSSRLGL